MNGNSISICGHETDKLIRLIHGFPWVTDFVTSVIRISSWRFSGFVRPVAIVIQAEKVEIAVHW